MTSNRSAITGVAATGASVSSSMTMKLLVDRHHKVRHYHQARTVLSQNVPQLSSISASSHNNNNNNNHNTVNLRRRTRSTLIHDDGKQQQQQQLQLQQQQQQQQHINPEQQQQQQKQPRIVKWNMIR